MISVSVVEKLTPPKPLWSVAARTGIKSLTPRANWASVFRKERN